MKNITDSELAAQALSTWQSNPRRNDGARFALFGPDNQYHGAYSSADRAHGYVESVSDTEAWIGQGYRVIEFR